MTETELKEFLDEKYHQYNTPEFIDSDPIQIPHSFTLREDIEISGFLASTIAWGNRKMICNNCTKMIDIMQGEPAAFVDDEAYEALPDELNIHRTFFARNFKYMLRGLKRIYDAHHSLNDFAAAHRVGESDEPAWRLVELMQQEMMAANAGATDSRCLPTNLTGTALKRINMALRWLVRDDGIVDMGAWGAIRPSQLFIPLDVHVGNTARALGMIDRKANDKKTVLELTAMLRQFRPDDPVIYDYALFGIGVTNAMPKS